MLPEYFHGMKAEPKHLLMDIMNKHNISSQFSVLGRFTVCYPLPGSYIQSLIVCVTICNQHPEIINTELPKIRDAEESDVSVADVELPSLLPYNTYTTADYSGLNNNLLSFQIVPTNPGGTPEFLGVALLMHMPTYLNHHM